MIFLCLFTGNPRNSFLQTLKPSNEFKGVTFLQTFLLLVSDLTAAGNLFDERFSKSKASTFFFFFFTSCLTLYFLEFDFAIFKVLFCSLIHKYFLRLRLVADNTGELGKTEWQEEIVRLYIELRL